MNMKMPPENEEIIEQQMNRDDNRLPQMKFDATGFFDVSLHHFTPRRHAVIAAISSAVHEVSSDFFHA